MGYCVVADCGLSRWLAPGLSLRWPKIPPCGRNGCTSARQDIDVEEARACGRHLIEKDCNDTYLLTKSLMNQRVKPVLRVGAVPSVNLPASTQSR